MSYNECPEEYEGYEIPQKEASVGVSDSTRLLGDMLASFPFIKFSRSIRDEEGNVLIEWQFDGKYFDALDNGNGEIEIIAYSNGKFSHWILKPDMGHTPK
jgi:hypothetical protein